MKFVSFIVIFLFAGSDLAIGQNFTEILGRPTNTSVTISILFDQQADVYWEYGLSTGNYTMSTSTFTTLTDTALIRDFSNLSPDTKHYYRTRYRPAGSSGSFLAGPEHTFHTPRSAGSSFTFAIEADPHLDTNSNPASYTLTLQNILSQNPDFLIDLGDNFMSEKLPVANQVNITGRHFLYRSYYGATCHSVPLYLVLGNHEGELGWLLNGSDTSLPVMAANTRKLYYPNPEPNSFYTGNTLSENYVGLRQNYYSWQWGNALFIVLDPYWYTITKPAWGWTLGTEQYNWFKNVVTTSTAKFKFVFCHQLVGGSGTDGRGGVEFAQFFENGGFNLDSTYGFDTYRPGWEKSIHTLMVENHVNIFFHGHDHCYARQDKDGIVYQEVPQPSSKNIANFTGSQFGYVNGVLLPSRGYLLVSITDTSAKVDYVKTYLPDEVNASHQNGQIANSYTILAPVTAVEEINIPGSFELEQNYPNPFCQQTIIKYKILAANTVQITVFDIFGREILRPVNQYQESGNYYVPVNAKDLASTGGVYYYRISYGNYSKSMKMICIK